jgi:PII-like signaling protein
VNEDCLKLTIYFGERDRCGGHFLADALTDIYARHELQTSLVMRGVEGFGAKHHLHTDRLLTLSEDLPLVSVAVDTRTRIQAALKEIEQLSFHGLVTLERARMLTGRMQPVELPPELGEGTKLTVYVGRQERVGTKPAYQAIVDLMHRSGVHGATVVLGVDGTAHGVRQRARFFGKNAQVPLMVVAVGEGPRIAGVLPELDSMLRRPLVTLERVRVCKLDGQRLAEPSHLPQTDVSGLSIWQKLMVYTSEHARHDDQALHRALTHALRRAGAAGSTSLRGIWGYHAGQKPHGDSFWQLQRRVPIVVITVDTPERIRTWFELIDRLTEKTGSVTSEMVPAFRATGPDRFQRGELKLANMGDRARR